ncbi:MAG: hypothetical protein KIT08_02740 [Anaerolineales bacterium]|nr:MAG: hypothetical protein KIT08_02740 [Anaerolineales bacterium]
MKKIIAMFCCFVAVVALVFLSFRVSEKRGLIYGDFLAQQVSSYKSGHLEYIDFALINSEPWDRVFVFTPYTPPEVVNSVVCGIWPGAWLTNIQHSDYATLLLFVKDCRVVQHVMFRNRFAIFSSVYREEGYAPGEAKFLLRENNYAVWLFGNDE